jgi:hypothetical protein
MQAAASGELKVTMSFWHDVTAYELIVQHIATHRSKRCNRSTLTVTMSFWYHGKFQLRKGELNR